MSYTQLFYLNQWSTAMPPILDRLLAEHLADLQSKMEEIIWIAGQNFHPLHQRLVEIIDSLDPTLHQKLLLIPMMYQHIQTFLSHPTEENLEQIMVAYEAEYKIEQREGNDKPIWSLMADRYLSPSASGAEVIAVPKIDNCIVADFESPEVQIVELSSGVMNAPYQPFSVAEKKITLDKLHGALALIDKISLAAGRLVRNYVRIIRLRKADTTLTSSEQVPREIGSIRLLNVQKENFCMIDLMDNLIHEATHNFLSCYEQRYGSFLSYEPTRQIRPISPWSGNPIPYSAFTHAIFIYFSLYNFMRLAYRAYDQTLATTESDQPFDIDKEDVRRKIELCSMGFRSDVPIEKYLTVVGQSDPELLHLYQMCQQQVCSAYPV